MSTDTTNLPKAPGTLEWAQEMGARAVEVGSKVSLDVLKNFDATGKAVLSGDVGGVATGVKDHVKLAVAGRVWGYGTVLGGLNPTLGGKLGQLTVDAFDGKKIPGFEDWQVINASYKGDSFIARQYTEDFVRRTDISGETASADIREAQAEIFKAVFSKTPLPTVEALNSTLNSEMEAYIARNLKGHRENFKFQIAFADTEGKKVIGRHYLKPEQFFNTFLKAQAVPEATLKTYEKNEQLAEIAYKIAHRVHGPVVAVTPQGTLSAYEKYLRTKQQADAAQGQQQVQTESNEKYILGSAGIVLTGGLVALGLPIVVPVLAGGATLATIFHKEIGEAIGNLTSPSTPVVATGRETEVRK